MDMGHRCTKRVLFLIGTNADKHRAIRKHSLCGEIQIRCCLSENLFSKHNREKRRYCGSKGLKC